MLLLSYREILHVEPQVIISHNADLLLIGPWGTNFSKICEKSIFIQETGSEKVVCKMTAILFRPLMF